VKESDAARQVELLLQEMERLGERGSDGKLKCKFGALIKDDRCSNVFEVRNEFFLRLRITRGSVQCAWIVENTEHI
jgi:hypothetical protein